MSREFPRCCNNKKKIPFENHEFLLFRVHVHSKKIPYKKPVVIRKEKAGAKNGKFSFKQCGQKLKQLKELKIIKAT